MSTAGNMDTKQGSRGVWARAALFAIATVGAVAFTSIGRAQSGPGATFEVRFNRPFAVGSRGRETIEGEKHQTVTMRAGGQVANNSQEDTRVHFQSITRIVTVDAHGKPVISEHTVERFESDDAQGHHVLVPPGQVIRIERAADDASTTIRVNGQPIAAPARDALQVVLSLTTDPTSDDDVFGTHQRQAVGASWPMNSQVAQQSLASRQHVGATLTGQTQIVSRTTFAGTDCLELSSHMQGTLTQLPDLPPGSTVRQGTLEATFGGMFPIATNRPVLSQTLALSMHVVVDMTADGHPAQLEMTLREAKHGTFSPM